MSCVLVLELSRNTLQQPQVVPLLSAAGALEGCLCRPLTPETPRRSTLMIQPLSPALTAPGLRALGPPHRHSAVSISVCLMYDLLPCLHLLCMTVARSQRAACNNLACSAAAWAGRGTPT